MRHPRYCLTHYPGISSNITNATHFSMPVTPNTLVHHPCHPHWHVTLARCPHNPRQHVTHTGALPTLARHRHKHITHFGTPPTQACYPRHLYQHKQHAISQTSGYPIKLLKLLDLKFPEKIQQFLLLIFIFIVLTFYGLLSIFIEVEKCHRKIKLFQRKLVCLIQKTTILSKTNAQLFQKKLFPNINVVLAILL